MILDRNNMSGEMINCTSFKKLKQLSIVVFLMLVSFVGEAQTTFASPFSNNMVLQRTDNVKIWGSDNANTPIAVTTSWNSQTYNTTSGSDGKWSVSVATPERFR